MMDSNEFFYKYHRVLEDITNDSRGVFGAMTKDARVPFKEFVNDVKTLEECSILVHYYHNLKPYFWGRPEEFPYTSSVGPSEDGTPLIIRRALNWYEIPEPAKKYNPLCFTVLEWEFEVTTIFFNRVFYGIRLANRKRDGVNLENQFTREEISEFLENII